MLLPYYLECAEIVWHVITNYFTHSQIKAITLFTNHFGISTIKGTWSELLSLPRHTAGKAIGKIWVLAPVH